MTGIPPYPGAPRWVKILWIIGAALALLVVIMHVTGVGGHGGRGPGHHSPVR